MLRTWAPGLLAVMLLALASPAASRAQEDEEWVGKRVFTHFGTVLKIAGQAVDDEKRETNLATSGRNRRTVRVYKVEQVKNSSLLLVAENDSIRGWVDKGAVIPCDKAVEFYSDVIRNEPNNANAYVDRAVARFQTGQIDLAISDYDAAIRIDPQNENAYNNRAQLFVVKKAYDAAIADYTEAIRIDPKFSLAYLDRGHVWLTRREYDLAIADCNEAIRLDPALKRAYLNRGLAWLNKDNLDQALADFNETIRLDPQYALPYNDRGLIWKSRRHYELALADFGTAIRLDPRYALPYSNRGRTWLLLREPAKALADFDAAIRVSPRFAPAHNSRAWLLATCPDDTLRDGKKAIASATLACQMSGYSDAIFLDTLAASYAETGDFDAAVKWQEQALRLNPADADSFRARLDQYRDKKPFREPEPPE